MDVLPRAFLVLLLPAILVGSLQSHGSMVKQGKQPNVLVIITDDQGYGDVGAHGNSMIRTPALDRLHAESVRLTDFHVDPTCSPTRSALLTGRYSTRTGVWHTIMGRSLMAEEEETLAERMRAGGYRTGMFGKWHLGDNWPLRPQDQGFEHVVWHKGGGVGQGPDWWDNDYFDDTYEVNGEMRSFEGYCTDVWFREALAFIEQDDERPFFAYLSTNAPHGPFLVDGAYSRPYEEAGVAPTMARFYGMITNIDENLGRLRKRLEELGLAENTLLVFLTDNGTAAGHRVRDAEVSDATDAWPGFAGGMRGHKGSEYEGGHRVPCFWHWPGGEIQGGRDVAGLTAHIDVLPSVAELCGLQPPAAVDGRSLAANLRGAIDAPSERTLFVHSQRVQHPEMWRKCAVMQGSLRLINGKELYDLVSDPTQNQDLASERPEVVQRLRAEYEAWWASLEPAMARTVHIGLGGEEDPVQLMSHDWHTEGRGTPWHQNHVRNGYVGHGPWAVDVARAGRYEFRLLRWPAHLNRAMQAVHASLKVANVEVGGELDPSDSVARFEARLPLGPTWLHTTLRRASGEEHGAYFVQVRWLGE